MSDSTDKLTSDQIHQIGIHVAEMVKAAREDPEFRKEALEKLGFENPVVNKLLKYLGGGAAVGFGALSGAKAVDMISDKVQERRGAIEKAKYYKEMVDVNPSLKGSDVDAKMVQRHFNTLHKFNPEYASDPMVAGAYVHNSLAFSRPNLEILNNVVKARDSVVRTQSTPKSGPGQQFVSGAIGKATKGLMGS